MTTGHGIWEELAAGYALNALEPEDEQAFVAHLRGCDRCAGDLAAMAEVTGELAYAADPAAPPPDLGRRIMAAAAAERPAAHATPAPRRTRRRGRVWRPEVHLGTLATAAAVVLVLVLGTWNVVLRGTADSRAAALARRDAALSCLASPGAARFQLRSADAPKASACVAGERAYVVADRLDRNGPDAVYVLWWQDAASAMHPVERFDVTGTGTAVFELPIHVATADVRAMAISLEPGHALPDKPSRPIAVGARTP
jgi:anti-sigma-K factor RskA